MLKSLSQGTSQAYSSSLSDWSWVAGDSSPENLRMNLGWSNWKEMGEPKSVFGAENCVSISEETASAFRWQADVCMQTRNIATMEHMGCLCQYPGVPHVIEIEISKC
jgi:hypothetical protein